MAAFGRSGDAEVSTKQMLVTIVTLTLLCALLVWWLESFNRERLLADFHEQIEQLPTFRGERPTDVP